MRWSARHLAFHIKSASGLLRPAHGLAGEVLHKLRLYHIQRVIVQDTDLKLSERFRELMHEESGYPYVRMYADRMDVYRWITIMSDRQRR